MQNRALSRIVRATVFAATIGLALYAHAIDKETSLHKFSRTSGGYLPAGKLLMDNSGNLYGVTENGAFGVFELSPAPGGGWTYNEIFTFPGTNPDYGPQGLLVMDVAGNLYGVTEGASDLYGEIYELSPSASGTWTQAILYSQNGSGGAGLSPVVLDKAGNLFGTDHSGGANDLGYVFELSPSSGGQWTFQDIYDFSGADGSGPLGVVFDSSGNLYGATYTGGSGSTCSNGCGVVFELTLASGAWTESVLHNFDGNDGSSPESPLTIGPDGNIYGSASSGGRYGFGTVFELKLVSGEWQEHTLHHFEGSNTSGNHDGAAPNAGLVLYDGNLYGTTISGGGSGECSYGSDLGCGSAFELAHIGIGWKEVVLRDFNGLWEGAFPYGGLVVDSSGNLFGTTGGGGAESNSGVIFELSPASN